MLKKLTYGLMAAAAMSMGLTSCSSDDPGLLPDADGNVSFTVEMPASMATRAAYGDGLTATNLTAYVYLHGEKNVLDTKTNTFTGLKSQVTFNLAAGRDYDFVFVATAPNGTAVTYSTTDQQIKVNYAAGVATNDENLDCFYQTVQNRHVTTAFAETVKLYRPYAQVNIGTLATDLAAAENAQDPGTYIADLKTSLTTTAYSTLNVMDGTVQDQAAVTFTPGAKPATAQDFPYQPTKYSYLSMDYLMVPATETLVNCTFKVYSGATEVNSVPMDNIPVQRNYRTNIYGSLLTSNATWNVEIMPDFLTPDKTPKTVIDASSYLNDGVAPEDLLDYALTEGNKSQYPDVEIVLPPVPTGTQINFHNGKINGKNVTIKGTDNAPADTQIKTVGIAAEGSQNLIYINGSLNFENVTVNFNPVGDYQGFVCRSNETNYTNCNIIGTFNLYCGKCHMTNVTISDPNVTADNGQELFWTWGAGEVIMDNCTLNCNRKYAINVYGGYPTKLTMNNCTFNRTDLAKATRYEAAVRVNPWSVNDPANPDIVEMNNCTKNGFDKWCQWKMNDAGTDYLPGYAEFYLNGAKQTLPWP